MLHICVRNGNIKYLYFRIVFMYECGDRQSVTALKHIFLHGYNQAVPLCQTGYHFPVKGLHKPAVGKAASVSLRFQLLPHMFSCADHAAHSEKGNILFLVKHFPHAV